MKAFGNIVGTILCILLLFVIISAVMFFSLIDVFSKDKINTLININSESISFRNENGEKTRYYEDLIRDFNRYSFTTTKTEKLLESKIMKEKIASYIKIILNNIMDGEKITSSDFKKYFIENMDEVFNDIDLSETDENNVIEIFEDHGDRLFEKNVSKYIKNLEPLNVVWNIKLKIGIATLALILAFIAMICFDSVSKSFKSLGITLFVSGIILLGFSIGINEISLSNLNIDTEFIKISFASLVKESFENMLPFSIIFMVLGAILYVVFKFININKRLFSKK